jgi:hypothetical protein
VQEAADLKSKFMEMERLAEQRAAAAERLRQDLTKQREVSEGTVRSRDAAVAAAKREKAIVDAEIAARNKLNEALHVEVVWSDNLRAKEQKRREDVRPSVLAWLSPCCCCCCCCCTDSTPTTGSDLRCPGQNVACRWSKKMPQ